MNILNKHLAHARLLSNYSLTILFVFTSILAFGQNENYEKGLKAFESEKFLESFKLLKPFADEGDSKAEFIVGLCYHNPELNIKNDSLAIQYLTSSAEKLNTNAMKLLTMIYFQKGVEDVNFKIRALVWAEIAGAYDPAINFTTTRYLIRQYLNDEELIQVENILKSQKDKFDKISLETFYALNKQVKHSNENSKKVMIPENSLNLIKNPYSDWIYRWESQRFECDTMYYTANIEAHLIDSTINNIKEKTIRSSFYV